MEFDLVIAKGTVVDGTGASRFQADIGIQRGRITAMALAGTLRAPKIIDASGLVVAPGFIDIHSHADWNLPLDDHDALLAPMVMQGITTVVAGNCGHSPAPVTDSSIRQVDTSSEVLRDQQFPYQWRTMGEFLDVMSSRGLLLNAAFLVGHGTVRQAVMGSSSDRPSAEQLKALRQLVRSSLREGAFGLSAGLAYDPGVFAKNDELFALLRTTAEEGAIFTVHGRAYTWISPMYRPMFLTAPHNVRSVKELLGLARDSKVKLQLSHQIFIGRRTWPTHRKVLQTIDRAVDSGLDVAFDAFPYTYGNSTINAIFPDWVLDNFRVRIRDPRILQRLRREFALFRVLLGFDYPDIVLLWGFVPELTEFEGLNFGQIAQKLGISEFDAYIHVARESNGKARILLGTYSGDGDHEQPLHAVLRHPLCAFETDTILTRRGRHNPASFGTFPRVLGRYSRDLGLFSLEEAVRRMTSFPAERIGLADVGRISPGRWADIVIFDPTTIADNTTLKQADVTPSGIKTVLISGDVIAQNGALISKSRKGRVLRSS